MILLIGISGMRDDGSSIGAGKDAVADRLVVEHGFVRVAFGDAVKRVAASLYDFSGEQLWGSFKSAPDLRYPREHGPWVDGQCACCGYMTGDLAFYRCHLTPRFALQTLGTEVGRTLYEDTWVRLLLTTARRVLAGERYDHWRGIVRAPAQHVPGVVVPDVRWPKGNEGEGIIGAGFAHGTLWRVDRPGSSGTARHASERQHAHDARFSEILRNDGDLAALHERVDAALAREQSRVGSA